MSRLPRVVFDTNVVLSALVFSKGRLAPLRDAWQGARCRPLVSRVAAAELSRALAYPKFKLSFEQQRELLADYLPFCVAVRIAGVAPAAPVCRDPFDTPFLQLAVVGKADCLVTGDRDLHVLADRFACPIITPAQFIVMLAARGN